MICTNLKILFIDIPKTGSTSLKKFILKNYPDYYFSAVNNPTWKMRMCPEYMKPVMTPHAKSFDFGGSRHEPLISIYESSHYLHDYLIFTVVRDPFTRFKSCMMEILMAMRFKHGFESEDSLRRSANDPSSQLNDPFFLFPSMRKGFDHLEEDLYELQVRHIYNKLTTIHRKGGFENYNICSIPTHLWPQYYFTTVHIANPLPIRILSYENLKQDIKTLSEELEMWGPYKIEDKTLPHHDPIPEIIFVGQNFEASNSIKITRPEEKEGRQRAPHEIDPEFRKLYPTFDDFLPVYKQEKKKLQERFDPIFEQNRWLIEELYAEDYRKFRYEQQTITGSPVM